MALHVKAEKDILLCQMRLFDNREFVEAHITTVIEKAANRAPVWQKFVVLHKPSPDWLDNRRLQWW